MVELFTFAVYAQAFSQELIRQDDIITSAAISQKYVALGTNKGFIHLLNIQAKEAELIGPYTKIKHVATQGNLVACCTENKVIAYDSEQAAEVMNVDVANPMKVGIANKDLGQLAIICATETELILMQKGWVRVSKRAVKSGINGLKDMIIHHHLVCFSLNSKVEFFNLLQEKTTHSLTIADNSKCLIHWASAAMCFVSAGTAVHVLEYSQNQGFDTFRHIKSIMTSTIPIAIGSFNQLYLLEIDTNNLSVYSLQQELTFAAKAPVNKFLLSYNQSNSPFYLVGETEIYKISPLTAKDKLLHLIEKKKYNQAYELASKFKLDRIPIMESQVVGLIQNNSMHEASQLAIGIPYSSQVWNFIIQEFLLKKMVCLIVMNMPLPEDEKMLEEILTQVLDHKELIQFQYIIDKIPPHVVTKAVFLYKSIPKLFQDEVNSYFLKHGKIIEALEISLEVRSHHCFKILSEHPDTIEFVGSNPSYISILFEIDKTKASEYFKVKKEKIKYEDLVDNFDLRLKHIGQFPELWKQTFSEAKDNFTKKKAVIGALKYHPNPVEFIQEIDIEGCDDEIKNLIMSLGSYLKAYTAASRSAKKEIPEYFKMLYEEILQPYVIDETFLCQKCAGPLEGFPFILRRCGHHTHKKCAETCIFCKNLF
ncbi:unnamed protein product [Blepharisma stoltei]|uniref:Vps41 beta-propeller domain-containing protein n=1 Tax=Blepharisma stoltei TaxID=1481888 RepID=A0AAU9I6J5_9CILI|nr:unnamed protein product [Blepharisma stoltei]